MKRRLLFISQCYPIPLDGGGKIRTFSTLKAIASEFDIHAVFISERMPTKKQQLNLSAIGVNKQTIFLHSGPKENVKNNLLKLIFNYFRLRPHYVYQYSCTEAKQFIHKLIQSWKPEIIHVDHLNSAQFVPSNEWFLQRNSKSPILILDNHNVIHNFYYSRFRNTRKLIRKLYLFIEGSLNVIYEFIHYPRFNHIFSISDTEVSQITFMNKRVSVLPTQYPIKHQIKNGTKQIDLLFVGLLDWPPNEEGLRWFLDHSYPTLAKIFPHLSICVIGGSDNLYRFKQDYPEIYFPGNVKSIDSYLSKSKVFFIPLLSGSGLCIKVLTALSCEIPIVSTTYGIRGYDLIHNKHVVLGDSPDSFTEAIHRLLLSEDMRHRLASNGKKYFDQLTNQTTKNSKNMYLHAAH